MANRNWLIIPFLLCLAAAPAVKNTPAQDAKILYEAAMSRYNDSKWKDASDLLEQFISKFPTHERAPVACLQLAQCRHALKDFEKFDAPLDEALKKYTGSRFWLYAYGSKLARLRDLKENDKYLEMVSAIIQRCGGQAPLALAGIGSRDSRAYWYFRHWDDPIEPTSSLQRDWGMDLVTMADTPARAEQALKLLEKTLEKRRAELPIDWQFSHAALLRQAGRAEESAKVLQGYVDGWGMDPRVVGLMMLQVGYLASQKDKAAVDAIYDRLVKEFAGYGNVDEHLYSRFKGSSKGDKKDDRYDEYKALATHLLRTYPTSNQWFSVLEDWVNRGVAATRAGKTGPAEDALAMVDEFEKAKLPDISARAPFWKLRLAIALKKTEEATKLGEFLVSDDQWSAANYTTISDSAAQFPALAPVVENARKTRGIPLPDAAGKPAGLLKDLLQRLKQDEDRHADEIAEELFKEHREDAATIDAVLAMVQYYFKKVMPEPRDRWMQRMIDAYPQHPSTQTVFGLKITSLSATREYEKLAEVVDLASLRFPGAAGQWQGDRLTAYDKMQDQAGALAYVKAIHSKRADMGNVSSMELLFSRQRGTLTDSKLRGDFWMGYAARFPKTRHENDLLAKAFGYYFNPSDVQADPAIAVARRLREQSLDPHLRWAMEFAEVNVLARVRKGDAAIKALDERLTGEKYHDLSCRLHFHELGVAMGTSGKVAEGAALAAKLKGKLYTTRDLIALEVMQGQMYQQAGAHKEAAQSFLAAVYLSPFPATMHPFFQEAQESLRSQPNFVQETQKYAKLVQNAQDVAPLVALELGRYHVGRKNEAVLAVRGDMIRKYPHSESLEQLNNLLTKVAQPRKGR